MRYIGLALILLLSSCVATKQVETKNHTYTLKGKEVKSFNRSDKAYRLNQQGSRVFSLYQFPAKDSVIEKTEYVKGSTDTVTIIDIVVDTINKVETKYIYKYINKTDTVFKNKIVIEQDMREIGALMTENSTIKENVLKAENKASFWRKIAYVSIGLLLAAIIVIVVMIKR